MIEAVGPVGPVPDAGQLRQHPHRPDGLGVAVEAGDDVEPHAARGHRLPRGAPNRDLGGERQPDHQPGADEHGDADPDVEQEAQGQIDRQPRQVEEHGRPAAGEEAADLIEVAHELRPVAADGGLAGPQDGGAEDALAQSLVDMGADRQQQPAADEVEQAVEGVEQDDQGGETHQRRQAVARQHPVVDLQHVERAAEREEVQHAAQGGDEEKRAAAGADRLDQRMALHTVEPTPDLVEGPGDAVGNPVAAQVWRSDLHRPSSVRISISNILAKILGLTWILSKISAQKLVLENGEAWARARVRIGFLAKMPAKAAKLAAGPPPGRNAARSP